MIVDDFYEHKRKYFILLGVSVLGLILGITFAATSKSVPFNMSFSGYFCASITVKAGSLFLKRMFTAFICSGIFFGCGFCVYLMPLSIFTVFWRGWFFGMMAVLAIVEYSFSGVLILVIVLIPQQAAFNLTVIVGCCRSMCSSVEFQKYGCNHFKRDIVFHSILFGINLILAIAETILIAAAFSPLLI